MIKPIKVICVTPYFLPGYKGGGPITTIENMRSVLKDEVDIDIFTRDFDLGSDAPYQSVRSNSWNYTASGLIYYASKTAFNYHGLRRAIQNSNKSYDVLYLNSFFGFRASIEINLRFHRQYPEIPILLAPRGEFSQGALAIKSFKKKLFIAIAKLLGLYNKVKWHASTSREVSDIVRQFSEAEDSIYVAEDPVTIGPRLNKAIAYDPSPPGHLRLAFISRISPMKNLDALLGFLARTTCLVDLDIFGPIEDVLYWRQCERLIATLPRNVNVSYRNELNPVDVTKTFATFDLFAFPTRGENFGHVIFEALRAGTPVLISDLTPWKSDPSGAVSVVPLADTQVWVTSLQTAAEKSVDEKRQLRIAARAYAEQFTEATGISKKNLAMFRAVIQDGGSC